VWRQALSSIRNPSPSRRPIMPYPSSVAILPRADKTGWACRSHIPGIPCLDFGELSRVATIIWSLRDKHPWVLMLMRMRDPAIARHLRDLLISVSSVSLADVASRP
jgi:hypothetical protein